MALPVESPRSGSLILAIEANNEAFVHSLVMAPGGRELILLAAPDGRTPWSVANDGNHQKIAQFFRKYIGEALRLPERSGPEDEEKASEVGSLPKEMPQPVACKPNAKKMRSFSLKLAEATAKPLLQRVASH